VAGEGDARLLEWIIQLPDQESVEAATRSLGGAGHAAARSGSDAVVTDPWGTNLRLTTV
jgi:hypothetical protein